MLLSRRVTGLGILGALAILSGCRPELRPSGAAGGLSALRPTVVSLVPACGARDVPVDATVRISFDLPMDPATVNEYVFQLRAEGRAGAIPAQVAPLDAEARAFSLAPDAVLEYETIYTVLLLAGPTSLDGASVDLEASPVSLPCSFVTEDVPDTTPPAFPIRTRGADAISPYAVRLWWAPAFDGADPGSTQGIHYAIYVAETTGGQDFDHPAAVTTPGAVEWTVSGLEPATRYYAVVRAVDAAGNADDNAWEIEVRTHVAEGPVPLTIVFSADSHAELAPCGCTVGQAGGLSVRATCLNALRQSEENIVLLDGGDFIAAADYFPPKTPPELRLAAQYMIRGMNAIGYDAAAIGEGDLHLGRRFFGDLEALAEFPLLSASIEDPATGEGIAPAVARIRRGGVTIGIASVLSPRFQNYVDFHEDPDGPATIRPLEDSARAALQALGDDVQVRILLAHVGWTNALALAEAVPGFHLILSAHDTFIEEHPEGTLVGETRVAQGGWDGKMLVRIDVTVEPDGTCTTAPGARIWLGVDDWQTDPATEALLAQYVEDTFNALDEILAEYPVLDPPTGGRYVGSDVCEACHMDEALAWHSTRHANAFQTLVDRGRHYDPQCIACHSTGFGWTGGFRLVDRTPEMIDVGCEMCHGPGQEHTDAPGAPYGPISESTCLECHVPEHSANFDYSVYRPLIDHGTEAQR